MPKQNQFIHTKWNHKERGFSFIEVMLASFLLVIGVLASVTLLTKGLKESLDSRSQIIAALLAQEGIELVRNIRDNNWTASRLTFANLPAGNVDDCRIDLSYSSLDAAANCDSALDKTLYISPTTKLYNATQSGTPTRFKRKISISYDVVPNTSATKATINSMTIWGTSFPPSIAECTTAKKCAFVSVTLTNWGEN